jgi:hypothetical protein
MDAAPGDRALPAGGAGARRPVALSALLALLALGSLFGFVKAVTARDELLALYPRLRPLWIPYLCIPALNLWSVVAMWRWRRWGFGLACATAAIAMAIEFSTMGPALHVWRVPLAFALLAALVRREWRRFR